MPTSYFLIAISGIAAVHWTVPAMRIVPFPWNLAGLALLAAGIWLNLSADNTMKRHRTAVKPFEAASTLITGGVFGFTRNPMYLGMTCMLAGIALLFGSATPWVFVMCFVVVIRAVFIAHEERTLETTFGDAFTAYRKRVRRWL